MSLTLRGSMLCALAVAGGCRGSSGGPDASQADVAQDRRIDAGGALDAISDQISERVDALPGADLGSGADTTEDRGGPEPSDAADGLGSDRPADAPSSGDGAATDATDAPADRPVVDAPAADAPSDAGGDRPDGARDAIVDRIFADAFDSKYPSIKVAQVAIGWSHTHARLDDGTVRSWGSAYDGDLGLGSAGTAANELRPVAVPGLSGVVDVVAGEDYFGCALLAGGDGVCWGSNIDGELGDGTESNHSTPAPIVGLAGAVELVTGGWFACARLGDGTMKCWGDDGYGELGFSSGGAHVLMPTAVPGLTGVTQMAAGQSHTCALLADRTVSCWGLNGEGQLGDGTTTTRPQPMTVPGLSDVVQIAADYVGTCALRSDGSVWCWGYNRDGEVGDGTMAEESHPVPARAAGITDAVRIAAGDSHNCAVLKDGSVECWGANRYGQLGDGTTAPHATPAPVMAIGDAVDIVARGPNVCVILNDRSVRCWGEGANGRLGNGDTKDSPVPVEPAW